MSILAPREGKGNRARQGKGVRLLDEGQILVCGTEGNLLPVLAPSGRAAGEWFVWLKLRHADPEIPRHEAPLPPCGSGARRGPVVVPRR